jgi:hypothetical protein
MRVFRTVTLAALFLAIAHSLPLNPVDGDGDAITKRERLDGSNCPVIGPPAVASTNKNDHAHTQSSIEKRCEVGPSPEPSPPTSNKAHTPDGDGDQMMPARGLNRRDNATRHSKRDPQVIKPQGPEPNPGHEPKPKPDKREVEPVPQPSPDLLQGHYTNEVNWS